MMNHKFFPFLILVVLAQFNMQSLAVELFSFSLDSDGLKEVKIVNTVVHDAAKMKEEAEKEARLLLVLQQKNKEVDIKLAEEELNLQVIRQRRIAAEENLKRKKNKILQDLLKA